MGTRLIIQHGQRITRHELIGRAIVIGRDPSCDLFFADQKLSRRHARVESSADGVKLTDLGSRNGSWVNEQRVEEQWLQLDDKVRVGRLQITIEEVQPVEASQAASGDATVIVSDAPVVEEMGNTVRLDSIDRKPERTGEVSSPPDDTLLFKEATKQDRDQTVVLPGASSPGDDGGTAIFHPPYEGEADTMTHDPALAPTEPALAREESTDPVVEELMPTAVGVPVGRPTTTPSAGGAPRGSLRPLLVTVALSLVAYLLLAVPLLSIRSTLREESLARGRALVDLLAAQNETALTTGEDEALSVESVSRRSGVSDAFVLDERGLVLAPVGRSGETYETIEDTSKKVSEIGDYFQERTSAGDYVVVRPLTDQGERVGFAVLRYSGVEVAEGKAVPLLIFLGFLLIVGGAWGSYFLTRKKALEVVATETTLSEHSEPTLTDF